jgi:hypothetical protein
MSHYWQIVTSCFLIECGYYPRTRVSQGLKFDIGKRQDTQRMEKQLGKGLLYCYSTCLSKNLKK